MSVRLRLQRKGTKKRPFYRIVVADQRAPRDGRYIEQLGIYDPLTKPAVVDLDVEKADEWIGKGAQPTDTVRIIIRKFKAGETQTKQELESRNRQARKDRREAAAKGLGAPPKAAPVEEESAEAKPAADSKPAAEAEPAADASETADDKKTAAAAEKVDESAEADAAEEPKKGSADAAADSDGDDA